MREMQRPIAVKSFILVKAKAIQHDKTQRKPQ